MSDNSENQIIYNFISKKAFELSYALCRISQSIENKSFSKVFEEKAIEILSSATEKNLNNIEQTIFVIEYFLRLAEAINLIRQNLVEILIAEFNSFKQYIKENKNKLFLPNIEISTIFETNLKNSTKYSLKTNLLKKNKVSAKNSAKELLTNSANQINSAIDLTVDSAKKDDSEKNSDLAINSANTNFIYSAINNYSAINSAKDSANQKDSAIVSKNNSAMANFDELSNLPDKNNQEIIGFKHISQIIKDKDRGFQSGEYKSDLDLKKTIFFEKINILGEFKLKDLEDLFPDLSERTIRYYLSDLVSRGLVEKVGISGPNVLYRLKK